MKNSLANKFRGGPEKILKIRSVIKYYVSTLIDSSAIMHIYIILIHDIF